MQYYNLTVCHTTDANAQLIGNAVAHLLLQGYSVRAILSHTTSTAAVVPIVTLDCSCADEDDYKSAKASIKTELDAIERRMLSAESKAHDVRGLGRSPKADSRTQV